MFVETKTDGENHVADAGKMVPKPDLGGLRVDRILALAEEIERPRRGLVFDMGSWARPGADSKTHCGSICCIGGHAQIMWGTNKFQYFWEGGTEKAAKLLGLRQDQIEPLFFPWYSGGPHNSEVDRSWAARVLRHLAQTGEVNWQV